MIMNETFLTVGNNAIHMRLAYGPHMGYSIVLKVTGGPFKAKLPSYSILLKNKTEKNHTTLPPKSWEG